MITLFVRHLPRSTPEESLNELFSQYGRVRSLKLVKDLFTGECKGFATIEMEGHEARKAIAALDNAEFEGKQIRVSQDQPRFRRKSR
jgi:RNA recognition motif-containing protein